MIKLHLGCGPRNFGPEWYHIDGGDFPHVGSHDITKLGFPDETVDLIYASHVISYFDRLSIISVLAEWNRVLKPGGVLRLATPDFEKMAALYINHKTQLCSLLGPLYGQMKMGSKTIYHQTVYDFRELILKLEQCGFADVKRYNWRETEHAHIDDHSQAYIPHMDKSSGTLISLNVEGVKLKI